ncbi:MAG: RIP metalloprotease RseP [Planctomycetes bacterium]|nr:RIP metalloprotease RseP [Planctomycetota bacterium]
MFENLGNILLAALGISFLISMHELGHFLAARLFGVRVETFSIGFGPRVYGWRSGDTDYRISAVPLGGYVKMAGEYGDYTDDETSIAPDDLMAKPIWQRFVIFSGGVVMNFALAFVIFPIAFGAGVPFEAPVVGGVAAGGPAWSAGLQPGDEIVAVSGRKTYGFSNILNDVALCDPDDLVLTIRRDGVESTRRVVPDKSTGLYDIGIEPGFDLLPRGPAAEAGLQAGDQIVSANGITVGRRHEGVLVTPHWAVLRASDDGRPLDLVVSRDGATQTLHVVPEAIAPPAEARRILGATPITTRVAKLRGAAERGPLHVDDLLLEVAGSPVVSSSDVYAALSTKATLGQAEVRLRRGDDERTVTLDDETIRAVLAGDLAFGPSTSTRIRVVPDSALAEAGLHDGDTIVAIDGEPLATYQDLQKAVQRDESRVDYDVRYRRGDVENEVSVRTRAMPAYDYGIALRAKTVVYDLSFAGSLAAGWDASLDALRATALTLTKLFTGDVGADQLSGPIQISKVTYTLASREFSRLLFFLALLSVNLGVINILPVPVLDGGQILFLLLEKIKGSRLSERFMSNAQLVGLVFILALMVYVTFNDIRRLFP